MYGSCKWMKRRWSSFCLVWYIGSRYTSADVREFAEKVINNNNKCREPAILHTSANHFIFWHDSEWQMWMHVWPKHQPPSFDIFDNQQINHISIKLIHFIWIFCLSFVFCSDSNFEFIISICICGSIDVRSNQIESESEAIQDFIHHL